MVPAEPGRGVVIDINVTKDCAAIESKMEKLFDLNDFTMKNDIAFIDKFCKKQ